MKNWCCVNIDQHWCCALDGYMVCSPIVRSQKPAPKKSWPAIPPANAIYPPTAVDAILSASPLPPAEKEYNRINDEVSTLTGAGFESTAQALRVIIISRHHPPHASLLQSHCCLYSDRIVYLLSALLESWPWFDTACHEFCC